MALIWSGASAGSTTFSTAVPCRREILAWVSFADKIFTLKLRHGSGKDQNSPG